MKRVLILAVIATLVCFPAMAMAQGHEDTVKKQEKPLGDDVQWAIALAMGFGLAIAVFGGAIGQSRGIAASVEAMARQPEASGKIMGAMIIGLALIETLVIYMLLICFMLNGKLTNFDILPK